MESGRTVQLFVSTWFLSHQLQDSGLALVSDGLQNKESPVQSQRPQTAGHWRACPHHIGVRAVGQPERSAVVLLVQLGLSEAELAEFGPDLPASLQGLAVLWQL